MQSNKGGNAAKEKKTIRIIFLVGICDSFAVQLNGFARSITTKKRERINRMVKMMKIKFHGRRERPEYDPNAHPWKKKRWKFCEKRRQNDNFTDWIHKNGRSKRMKRRTVIVAVCFFVLCFLCLFKLCANWKETTQKIR